MYMGNGMFAGFIVKRNVLSQHTSVTIQHPSIIINLYPSSTLTCIIWRRDFKRFKSVEVLCWFGWVVEYLHLREENIRERCQMQMQFLRRPPCPFPQLHLWYNSSCQWKLHPTHNNIQMLHLFCQNLNFSHLIDQQIQKKKVTSLIETNIKSKDSRSALHHKL